MSSTMGPFVFFVLFPIASFVLTYGIIRFFFKEAASRWSGPKKAGIYIGVVYLIFAMTFTIMALVQGGEGQLIILLIGFPTTLLVQLVPRGIGSEWPQLVSNIFVIAIIIVNSLVVGGMVRWVLSLKRFNTPPKIEGGVILVPLVLWITTAQAYYICPQPDGSRKYTDSSGPGCENQEIPESSGSQLKQKIESIENQNPGDQPGEGRESEFRFEPEGNGESTEPTPYDQEALGLEIEGLLNELRDALLAGDIEGALEYFIEPVRERYRITFNEMGDSLTERMSSIEMFHLLDANEDMINAEAIREINGVRYSHPVTLMKDQDGNWKVQSF